MIDEIDYFPKRDQFKNKKKKSISEDWNELKKTKTSQDSKKSAPDNKRKNPETPTKGR